VLANVVGGDFAGLNFCNIFEEMKHFDYGKFGENILRE